MSESEFFGISVTGIEGFEVIAERLVIAEFLIEDLPALAAEFDNGYFLCILFGFAGLSVLDLIGYLVDIAFFGAE